MSLCPILFALKPLHVIFGVTMTASAVFLILLVLVQRGRGGGLAGAFGGMGGQSAFGTKAGDTFTRITIVVATVWILLCILCIKLLSVPTWSVNPGQDTAGATAPLGDDGSGATDSPASTENDGSTGPSDADAGPSNTDPGPSEGSSNTDTGSSDAGAGNGEIPEQ